MPVSKKRVKKSSKKSIPNLRRQFRNDARKSMQKILEGINIFSDVKNRTQELKETHPEIVPDDAIKNMLELEKELTADLKNADTLAREIVDDSKIEIPLKEWEETYLGKATSNSAIIEDILMGSLPAKIEAAIMLSTSFLTGGGVTPQALGFEKTEIKSEEDLQKL